MKIELLKASRYLRTYDSLPEKKQRNRVLIWIGFGIYDTPPMTVWTVFGWLICAIDEDGPLTSRKDTKTAFVNARLSDRRSRGWRWRLLARSISPSTTSPAEVVCCDGGSDLQYDARNSSRCINIPLPFSMLTGCTLQCFREIIFRTDNIYRGQLLQQLTWQSWTWFVGKVAIASRWAFPQ